MRNWSPNKIRQALAGLKSPIFSLSAIYRCYGLSAGACRQALIRPHRKAEAAIAKTLNVKPSLIWPNRYLPSGERLSPIPTAYYNGSAASVECQKSKAA